MANIGWIKIGLVADTAQLVSGMKKAEGVIKGFASHVGGSLKGLVAGALAGFTVGAGVAFVKSAMDASDAVHDMARELGVSNEELQKMHHVASVAGVDAGEMDSSLGHLNVNLAKIATEGGTAAIELQRFGISARQLATAGPVEAFQTSIDLLASIPNAAKRAQVAVELFGKSGKAMIRVAGEGAGAVKEMGDRAEKLGLVISNIDSEKINEANDAMSEVWDVVRGLGNSLAVRLAPYIKYVADLFVDWAIEGSGAGSKITQAIDWVKVAIGGVVDAVQLWQNAFLVTQTVVLAALSKITKGISVVMKNLEAIGTSPITQLVAPAAAAGWEAFSKKQKTALVESNEFFKNWSEALEDQMKETGEKAAAAWKKPWNSQTVRTFLNDIEIKAQQRAQLAAGKEEEFRKGGAFQPTRRAELGFGGAVTMGSKEAYSAILKARSQQINSKQDMIQINTKTTAEATSRSAVALERIAQAQDRKQGADLSYQNSAGL